MVRSVSAIECQDVPRPLVALAVEYEGGLAKGPHCHRRAQLMYGATGSIRVSTSDGTWVVPPQWAAWISSKVDHEVYCNGPVAFRTVYIEAVGRHTLPQSCQVLKVSPLLRELLVAAVDLPAEYELQGRGGRIMELILDEIAAAENVPTLLPMPQHPGLRRLCDKLLDSPAMDFSIESVAKEAGMSRSTFIRHFQSQTGLGFSVWRQQARLIEALTLLSSGRSISSVAFAVGYDSPSAFSSAFRRNFGVSPTEYLSP